jgi:predicted transglutaminase-like cysteine proteinase
LLTGPQPHSLTLIPKEKRTGLPATASGRGVNTMGIRVTARRLARLLPLAFIVAVPLLVSATPEHRDGAVAWQAAEARINPTMGGKLAALPLRIPSLRPEPFALGSPPSALDAIRAKWLQVRNEIAQDAIVLAGCRSVPETCPPAARPFLDLIDTARGKDGRALLGEINRAVNLTIRYVADLTQHGIDVWSSPLATFASGQGDCEDYAIAKYLALRESGIAAENLRLVVVETRRGSAHAVLAARLDDRWLLLDNTALVLVPDYERADYRPLIAFGAEAYLAKAETALIDRPLAGSM